MKSTFNHEHAGHRERLRDRVRNYSLKSLQPHEVLELLLTYTIPYKDTNKLAHQLLDEFGSLANVIDADKNDLCKFVGISEHSALFLNILSEFIEIYKSSRDKEEHTTLTSTSDLVSYFRNHFEVTRKENLIVLCLNSKNLVIKKFQFDGLSDCEISLSNKQFISKILNDLTKSIVIFHTHPAGSTQPSNDDIVTTTAILQICKFIGVELLDHIIFNEKEHFSFRSNNMLKTNFNTKSQENVDLTKMDDNVSIMERKNDTLKSKNTSTNRRRQS